MARGWWEEDDSAISLSEISTFRYETQTINGTECLIGGGEVSVLLMNDDIVTYDNSDEEQNATGMCSDLDWYNIGINDVLKSLQILGMQRDMCGRIYDQASDLVAEHLKIRRGRTEKRIVVEVYPPGKWSGQYPEGADEWGFDVAIDDL